MRPRILASLQTTVAMVALPLGYALLQHFGPSSRVAFWPYLPTEPAEWLLAAVAGAAAGAELPRLLHPSSRPYAPLRLALGALLGGGAGLVAALWLAFALPTAWLTETWWIASALASSTLGGVCGGLVSFKHVEPRPVWRPLLTAKLAAVGFVVALGAIPQLRALPAHGTLAERDAWARANVREYPGLVHVVKTLPQVTRDLGRVVRLAPTGADKHSFAREMDGDDLHFTLEVVGDKGTGTLQADCTISGDQVLDWRSGTWRFDGKVTPIQGVPHQR